MKLQQGFNLIGKLEGAVLGSNDQYYRIGITEHFQNEYGSTETRAYRVGIYKDSYPAIMQSVSKLTGKIVVIRCRPRVVEGRNGAFLSLDFEPNSTIQELPADAS